MDEAGPLSSFLLGLKVDGNALRRRRRCYLCGDAGGAICEPCRLDLPRFGHAWAAPSTRHAPVDEWLLPYVYASPLTTLVRRAKFRRDLAAMAACTALIEIEVSTYFLTIKQYDCVVPVPLAFWRYLARGYNQASLLARAVAEQAGLPAADGIARRRGYQRPQSELHAAARRRNVAGIFAARRRLDGAGVLIVDDVVTTGATGAALAAALKEAGAARVGVMALAATP